LLRLSFHGADRGVTGSCHMVAWRDRRILVDCGLLQGSRELAEENAAPFGFDAEEIDYLLLTHAHLDHCGRLPLLVKRGFRGEVITTAASRELARLVMLDAAHLQAEEGIRHERRGRNSAAVPAPLCDVADANNSLSRFGRVAERGMEIPVHADIHTINGFSAHADQEELLAWHARVKGCTRTFLVHGEDPAMRQLAD
jgi:metallo-beta-lactamase family protein